jgi:serine/threonine protein kinase
VADDWTVKISDFGLSLHLTKDLVCRGFKGNVKYSPPEILRARYDKTISIYPYSEKTDVYSFGLMLWELVSLKQLFPTIKGKEELTRHVLAGFRPPLEPDWPVSLQELLALCWHQDPDKRPYFPQILKKYEQVVTDMLCPDNVGKKVIKRLWRGKITSSFEPKNTKVLYQDFEKVFIECLKLDFSRIKKIHLKCFNAVLCDSFDDTITFDRFCRVVSLFGPLQPVEEFFARIKDVLSRPYFHGFFNASKAATLVKSHWAQTSTKQHCYLYRFSSTDLTGLTLTYIDKKGEIYHKKIMRTERGYKVEDIPGEQPSFLKAHKACKTTFKLKKFVPESPYSVLFKAK